MKILVTGATGFVGSHLCERLLKEGHTVYALVRSSRKAKLLPPEINLIKGDLDPSSINAWVATLEQDLDAVVHTAGTVHSFENDSFYKVNTLATIDLIECLKKRYSALHFIFISSLAAVGPSSLAVAHTEEAKLSPPSLYGQSKKQAEKELQSRAAENWRTTIIRPPMVIGPRDAAVLDVYKMVDSGAILSTGLNGMNKLYSFVCVFDLITVITASLTEQKKNHDIFFCAHPQRVRFFEIIDQIKRQMKKKTIVFYIPFFLVTTLAYVMKALFLLFKIELRLTPDKLHELKPMAWLCSGEKSERVLGVQYKWNLEHTIKLTYEDYCQRNWL